MTIRSTGRVFASTRGPITKTESSQFDLSDLHCLVVGAGGFLGSALCRALCDAGATVQGFGRIPHNARHLDARVVWTNAVFSDIPALSRAIQGQEIVFHLLGSSIPESSNREPAEDLVSNVAPSIRLFDLCREEGVRKVVFASSGGTIYGVPSLIPTPEGSPTDPISAYGINKLAIEKYLALYHHLYHLDYHVLRIANPYGPGQSPFKKQGVVAAMVHRALSRQQIEVWGDGEVTRDFLYIDDVSTAFLYALLYSGEDRVMNLGSGQGRTVNRIVEDISAVLDIDLDVVRKPGRPADVPVSILDVDLICRSTPWTPRVAWFDGLKSTVDWMRRNYPS